MAGAALRSKEGECLNAFDPPGIWYLCDMDWMCNGCALCEADSCTAVIETECTMTTVPTVAAHHAAHAPISTPVRRSLPPRAPPTQPPSLSLTNLKSCVLVMKLFSYVTRSVVEGPLSKNI